MSDLISRSVLLDIVENKYRDIVAGAYPFNIVAYELSEIIKEQPTVEAIPKEKLDEIVERLEEIKQPIPNDWGENVGSTIDSDRAIEIVKGVMNERD